MKKSIPLRIGIVGGGFTGTALLALLCKRTSLPLHITIYDKSGQFGAGPAYRTPFTHHLLNVRAQDMSAFEEEPLHFVNWLSTQKEKLQVLDLAQPFHEQFVPRLYYYEYLQDLLKSLKKLDTNFIQIDFKYEAVCDVLEEDGGVLLFAESGERQSFDQVIFAIGNNPHARFPFPVAKDMQTIENPWDYRAVSHIETKQAVLIIGTGLSMIDAVLTLKKQGHQGLIYALSRHGLLPLPHNNVLHVEKLDEEKVLAAAKMGGAKFLAEVRKWIREHTKVGGDWRSVIGGLRLHVTALWQQASQSEKRQFLQHVLPYWSIHRHRVHAEIADILQEMMQQGQLQILAGRVLEGVAGKVIYKDRQNHELVSLSVDWLVNCMGPEQIMKKKHQPLVATLLKKGYAAQDDMGFGFKVSAMGALINQAGETSDRMYAVGAPTRGCYFEVTAVPDIRKQVAHCVSAMERLISPKSS